MPQAENASNPLADCLVLLQTSRRFAAGSGIGALAQAVNAGNGEMVKGIIDSQWSDVRWLETNVSAPAGQQPHVRKQILQFLTPLLAAKSPQAALQALGQRRILCGLREGPGGVAGVNHLVEQHQRRQQLIGPEARVYAGLPILISRNDYSQGLFNGDTGVLWPDAKGLMRGWFEQEDGSLRSVALAQLPAWQVAYAMTVHKSQGSEFDQVLLLLPQEDAPVLTRELLYTGITRARQQLILCAPLELFLRTTGRQVIRYSGLPRKMTTPPPQLNQE
jgi:exodeoxyribonuclease V alpha subunit